MLNRFSNVTKEGKFETSMPNIDKRFAISLGSLSFGRLTIIACSVKVLGYALKIAVRFSAMRK